MEYTIQKLSAMAGITSRTLRYYDQIGLLCPARISSSGYRIYGQQEVDQLQQILYYREMDLPLEEIKALLNQPGFDRLAALREHHQRLVAQQSRTLALIHTIQRTISAEERGIPMNDNEKFEGFRKAKIDTNEAQYGAEIREKYGDETINASNAKLGRMTKEQWAEMEEIGAEILRLLDQAFPAGEPASEAGQALAALHQQWLGYTWSSYSPEAHRGLADMYVQDDRFAAYYDRGTPGKAHYVRDAIHAYLDR